MASGSATSTGTSSLTLRRYVKEEMSNPGGELHNQTFITNPDRIDTQILGPAFFDLPLKFTSCYPIVGEGKLIKDQDLNFADCSTKNFVCWPVQDSDWNKWTNHILKFKRTDLKGIGLWHIISLLRYGIPQNPALIHAALAFWDSSFNYFRFNCGMMAPTVLDVSFLTGLPPFGPMFDISNSIDIPFLKVMKTSGSYASFGNFLRNEAKFEDKVSDREFFAYLLYTLCKMIFCHSGKKIMLEFAPLAYRLSQGQKFDLASHFLGYVYKIGSDSQSKPLLFNIGGPLWFLQLWILAYFPIFEVAISEPVNVYGDKFRNMASKPLSLVGYLQYFYNMNENKEETEFRPFVDWNIGPAWIKDMMENRGATILLLLGEVSYFQESFS